MVTGWLEPWDGAKLDCADPLGEIGLQRAAGGYLISFHVQLDLGRSRAAVDPDAPPVAFAMHGPFARLEVRDAEGVWLAVADTAGSAPWILRGPKRNVHLSFLVASAALVDMEALRNVNAPRLRVHVQLARQQLGDFAGRTIDGPPDKAEATVEFSVSQEGWLRARQSVRLSAGVLVEIPLAGQGSKLGGAARKAFAEAVAAFERGGIDGWQTCAARLRVCMEKWDKSMVGNAIMFEKEDTLDTRMRKLRQAVRSVTHYAHHEIAEEWTRADALALLVSVGALLAREGL